MPAGRNEIGNTTAIILVNGTKLKDINLPQATEVVGPRVIDFGDELKTGTNEIAIQRAGDNSAMQTNVITSYYVPWAQSEATETENFKAGDTRALKLKVDFDRREAKRGSGNLPSRSRADWIRWLRHDDCRNRIAPWGGSRSRITGESKTERC